MNDGDIVIHVINGKNREVVFMASSGVWAMVRCKGCMPYLAKIKELHHVD